MKIPGLRKRPQKLGLRFIVETLAIRESQDDREMEPSIAHYIKTCFEKELTSSRLLKLKKLLLLLTGGKIYLDILNA